MYPPQRRAHASSRAALVVGACGKSVAALVVTDVPLWYTSQCVHFWFGFTPEHNGLAYLQEHGPSRLANGLLKLPPDRPPMDHAIELKQLWQGPGVYHDG